MVGYRKDEDKYFYSEKILSDRLTQNHFKVWGENLKRNNLALCWCVFSKNRLETALINKPVSSDYFGVQSGAATRISTYNFLKRDADKIFRDQYKIDLSKQDIFLYIAELFHSQKYKHFIRDNRFDKKNLPIPLWEEYTDYIKEGRKRISALEDKERKELY